MEFFRELGNEIYVLLIAMVPLIELRGAIPVGIGLGLETWKALLFGVIGSSIPAPFLILFFRKILEFMKKFEKLKFITDFLDNHIAKKTLKLKSAKAIGLYIFVAIPLPSTGAYTGSILASIFNMRLKEALPPIILGNLTAGLIMTFFSKLFFNWEHWNFKWCIGYFEYTNSKQKNVDRQKFI